MTLAPVGDEQLSTYLAFAERLADAVRPLLRDRFRTGVAAERQSDASPVTEIDRASEARMREMIAETFPEHGVLGEEQAPDKPDAEFVWVLDPLDGTRSFASGKATFGTLIALAKGGTPIVGIIDEPALNNRWSGARGRSTTYNGAEARVRPCGSVAEAWLAATSPDMFRTAGVLPAFEGLSVACAQTVYGGECTAYGALASGWLDLVVEADLGPYDFAALVPVVEGAGGVMTDWSGAPLTSASDGRVIAAGDTRAHARALEILVA